MSTPHAHDSIAARVDVVAADRLRRRLLHAAEPPWLHQESARRMAERLSFIKRQPALVLDWSHDPPHQTGPLTMACAKAQIRHVRDGAWPALPATWWQRLTGSDRRGQWLSPEDSAGVEAQLLWSNMGLHMEHDPLAMMRQWRRAMAADSFVMFTTLGPGSLAGLRSIYAESGWGECHAPFTDMHDLGDMLVEAGFADPVMDQETLTLRYSTPEALLLELREMGMNLNPARYAGLRSRAWLAHLSAALARRADDQGRIPLQWELVYGHAFRAADRGPTLSADTRIPLDDMKLMLRKRP